MLKKKDKPCSKKSILHPSVIMCVCIYIPYAQPFLKVRLLIFRHDDHSLLVLLLKELCKILLYFEHYLYFSYLFLTFR